MSFKHFIAVLRVRRALGLTVLATALGLALTISMLLPRQFTATSMVLLAGQSQGSSAGAAVKPVQPDELAMQVEVARSERVALRAVRILRLHESAELRAQWQAATSGRGDFEAWLAERMQTKVEVRASPEANVMTLISTAPDAVFAADAANALVKAYIATAIELKTEPAAHLSGFLVERAKELHETLQRAQARLAAHPRGKDAWLRDERTVPAHTLPGELEAPMPPFRTDRDDRAALQRDVEVADRAYREVQARIAPSRTESQLVPAQLVVLKEASVPPFPSSPRLALNVVVAGLLAALLLVAGIWLTERRNLRLRIEEDVSCALQQTLLVVLPRSTAQPEASPASDLEGIDARVLGGLSHHAR